MPGPSSWSTTPLGWFLPKRRGRFLRSHLVDLVVIALPLLRPLRLLRLITILNVLNRGVSTGLRGRVAIYVMGATVLTVLVGGLAMLDAERGRVGANIQSPGDAWWWAISTVTTVGYGDRYPVTSSGRVVAVALMVCGIALIGVVTASLASWLIERIRDEQTETRDDVSELLVEVRLLRAEVAMQRGEGSRGLRSNTSHCDPWSPSTQPRCAEGGVGNGWDQAPATFPRQLVRLPRVCRVGKDDSVHLGDRISEALVGYHERSSSYPGVLAALLSSDWEWAGAQGVADVASGRELRPEAAVRVASVTKTFTAAAVLRLVERDELRLDDRVAALASGDVVDVLEEGGYEPAHISVRHLLQHTAGLYDWGSDPHYEAEALADPSHRWSRIEQVRWAVDHGRPLAPPGAEFHYSDTGYVILGEFLERMTGRSLAGAYRTLLPFRKLGLDSIHLESLEPTPTAGADRAHQYVGAVDLLSVDPSCDLWGGGGIVASMPDLARFVRALFQGEVFDRSDTLATMTAPIGPSGAQGHGMGIYTLPLGPGRWWGHGGHWGTVMAYEPARDLALASTVTRMPEHPEDRLSLGRELVRAIEEVLDGQPTDQ